MILEIEVEVCQQMLVKVHLDDIVETINGIQMPSRWNFIAKLINEIDLSGDQLDENQKEVIKKYLNDKLAKL